jgi:hypothetical protein
MNRGKIFKFWVLWVFGFYGCAALNPEFSAQLAARVLKADLRGNWAIHLCRLLWPDQLSII